MNDPKIRIISDAPAVAERRINELYRDYQLLTVNISTQKDELVITAIMLHRSEIPRPGSAIAVPLPGGFRQ
jgi:hypothetical protein